MQVFNLVFQPCTIFSSGYIFLSIGFYPLFVLQLHKELAPEVYPNTAAAHVVLRGLQESCGRFIWAQVMYPRTHAL